MEAMDEGDVTVVIHDGIHDGSHIFHASDGHTYHHHSFMTGGRISVRCMFAGTKRNCKAKASFNRDGTEFRYGRVGYHNHIPTNNIIHQRRFRTAVLNECRKEENITVGLKQLYNRVRGRMRLTSLQIGGLTYVKLRSSMLRARRENLPPIPHSISELATILDDPDYAFLNTTLDGQDKVYIGKFGQSAQGTRCIMFASQRTLEYMQSPHSPVEEVLSDATFCVPEVLNCRQIWNIVTVRRNHVIVLVRFLMQTKSENCYKVCLEALKTIVPNFKPKTIMSDFEPAQCNAWESVYPLATLSGCLFHSSKAITLHAQELGLIPLIRQNEVVDGIIRSLCALALLPVESLLDGLECISRRCHEAGYFDVLQPFFAYVLRTWFQPDFMRRLSVYGCPDRTTNACESANATLAAACGTKKPSVYVFLYAIKQTEDSNWFDCEDLQEGFTCSRGRPLSALANDLVIKNLSTDLANRQVSVERFLEKASRRIQGVYDMILNI